MPAKNLRTELMASGYYVPNVREAAAACEEALAKLREHPMAFDITIGKRYVTVIFPPGDWPDGVGGARADYTALGKARAFGALEDCCERMWVASYPGGKKPKRQWR